MKNLAIDLLIGLIVTTFIMAVFMLPLITGAL